MYTPKYYQINDFLPEDLHTKYSDIEKIQLIDERIVRLSDAAFNVIQDHFGATGVKVDLGLIVPNEDAVWFNQHHFGRAVHLKVDVFEGLADEEERIKKYNELRTILIDFEDFKYATFESISDEYPKGLPYLHFDVRNNLTDSRIALEQNPTK